MELQEKVKEYLEVNGIKKIRLAELLGIYPTQLYKWLIGEYELSKSQIEIVKRFLTGFYNISIPLE